MLHVAIAADDVKQPVAQRLDAHSSALIDPRDLVSYHGPDQNLLVQHLVVLQAKEQRVGDVPAQVAQEDRSAGNADGRVLPYVSDPSRIFWFRI